MCMSPEIIFQLAIFVIIIVAAVALIQLVLPTLGPNLLGGQFGAIVRILIWAVVCIMIVVFIWRLAQCSGLLRL